MVKTKEAERPEPPFESKAARELPDRRSGAALDRFLEHDRTWPHLGAVFRMRNEIVKGT
jgi:hypothetical protein